VHDLLQLQHRRRALDAERAADALAARGHQRPHACDRERDRDAVLEQHVDHHAAGLDRGAQRPLGRQRDAGADHVAHHRDRLAVGEDRARDRPRRRLGVEPERLADLAAQPLLGDLEVAHRQRDAAPRGELRVRPQHLQALVERGRAHDLADVRPRPLAARDLAGVLEPVKRRAQRPARYPEHRRELQLGRQPVALAVRAGRQPGPQGLLGVVDE
jgi:hypothetical protein